MHYTHFLRLQTSDRRSCIHGLELFFSTRKWGALYWKNMLTKQNALPSVTNCATQGGLICCSKYVDVTPLIYECEILTATVRYNHTYTQRLYVTRDHQWLNWEGKISAFIVYVNTFWNMECENSVLQNATRNAFMPAYLIMLYSFGRFSSIRILYPNIWEHSSIFIGGVSWILLTPLMKVEQTVFPNIGI